MYCKTTLYVRFASIDGSDDLFGARYYYRAVALEMSESEQCRDSLVIARG